MPLLCAVLWTVLPLVALSSGSDHCDFQENIDLQAMSPPLDSLQCHNDFESHVHCKWKEHRNTPLQLWSKIRNTRKLCNPVQSEHGTVQCRYNTTSLAIGTTHNLFFVNNEVQTVCSSAPHKPLELSQLLRARPPGNLSTLDAGDGGWWLSWSSPYPSSSSLSKNLIYQLSYRTDSEDNWTTQEVTSTSVKLEKQLLLPGHRYQAKVRARAIVGQWSSWGPVVSWATNKGYGQFPSLHCVLNGETETTCSWEVSRELAHFITYQLSCRHNQTAPSEKCCVNLTVTFDPSGMAMRYSCSLITDPAHQLLLELLPKHNAKMMKTHQHIRPRPPQKLEVEDKNHKWKVEWKNPYSDSSVPITLYYEVCYYKTQDQAHPIVLNTTMTSVILQGVYLEPSQEYQVKVRSLVIPGYGSIYKGVPSEWTNPKSWISHQAPWSLSTFIYVLTGVFVITIFFMLYYTTPVCRRKVILWVDSVPSPGKSKILSDIKFATGRTLIQTENTSICKVQDLDTVSMCSSNTSLWPEVNKKCVEPDEGFWNSDDLPSPTERVNSNGFSGPYIFCQTIMPRSKTVDIKYKTEMKDEEPSPADPPSPVNFALYGKGYVCLPTHTVSRSTQDLVSYSDANTKTQRHDNDKENKKSPDTTSGSDLKSDVLLGLSDTTSRDKPLAQTSESFSLWPEGGATQASGYCHLPQPQW